MKHVIKMMAFILVLTMILPMSVSASNSNLPLRIVVNGERIYLPDAQPFIDANKRTQVPVRFVSEALGAKVDWNSKNQQVTVTMKAKKIVLSIGKKEYTVDGIKKQMDTQALIQSGRTFVPIRFVSEALGASVEWEEVIRTVHINTGGQVASTPQNGVKVATGHGFTFTYSKMGDNIGPVYVTESQLRVSVYEYEGKDKAILNLTLNFPDSDFNRVEATKEAEEILRQKVEGQVVDSIMEYIGGKTRVQDKLPQKIFSDRNYEIFVTSPPYGGIGMIVFLK